MGPGHDLHAGSYPAFLHSGFSEVPQAGDTGYRPDGGSGLPSLNNQTTPGFPPRFTPRYGSTGRERMNRKYRISVRNGVPPDLADRISALHAAAILHRQRSLQDCAKETDPFQTVVEPAVTEEDTKDS